MEKILVVVDMQNDFVDGALGTKEAQAIIPNVVNKIKNFDGKIFNTLDTHDKNYINTLEGNHLHVEHCIENTYGWVPNLDVMCALEDKNAEQVKKDTFGSFDLVKEIDVVIDYDMEIELIGLCTDICVISNALLLKTFFPEVEITVDASCCAGTTSEKHKAAIEVMKSCQINVIGEQDD